MNDHNLWFIISKFLDDSFKFLLVKRVKIYLRSKIWYFHSCHIVLLNNKKIHGEFCVFLNEIFFAECDFLNLQRISSIKCSFILWNVVKSKFKKKFLHMFSWACYSSRGLDCNPTVSLTLSLINVMTCKITNTF